MASTEELPPTVEFGHVPFSVAQSINMLSKTKPRRRPPPSPVFVSWHRGAIPVYGRGLRRRRGPQAGLATHGGQGATMGPVWPAGPLTRGNRGPLRARPPLAPGRGRSWPRVLAAAGCGACHDPAACQRPAPWKKRRRGRAGRGPSGRHGPSRESQRRPRPSKAPGEIVPTLLRGRMPVRSLRPSPVSGRSASRWSIGTGPSGR